MKLAVKSGIVFTSSYALQQYSHFLTTVTDEKLSFKLKTLQDELDSKIKIITPAINLIELRSGQGNSALESALTLTTSIQKGITLLGHKIASLTSAETSQAAIRHLVADIKVLIERINGSIPLLQLAISTSGESLSTNLPDSVSPSRMLQASAFLLVADSQFIASPQTAVQVGPDFIVSVYMIFKGYSYGPKEENSRYSMSPEPNLDDVRKPAWQEVLHKARLKLHRAPCQRERNGKQRPRGPSRYFYYLEIKEDRDDGRLHDDPTNSVGDSKSDLIPVTEITKLLYTNSAAILNIKDDLEANSTPILLLKREIDITNTPEYNASEDETQQHVDCQILSECDGAALDGENGKCGNASLHHSQFPSYLDPEWIALEMYIADTSDKSQYDQSDAESAQASRDESEQRKSRETVTDEVINQLSSLCLNPGYSPHSEDKSALQDASSSVSESTPTSLFSMVTTSLSLLELVIRLAVLQQTQQKSHLSIPDHVLTCFLNGTMQPNNSGGNH
ncbi:Ran GTP-binding protein [Beauveria brongniartii RCEF 3172]|uniref:Ran GTP-binding protein n=1 Tax=Beauveria brongniartii RCEF 3172 TaxID=1081107 RepID=A0A167DGH9_9HYPO|nr:Ran GTP-binding protein [Beauveria brongniartii RCEF 3172]